LAVDYLTDGTAGSQLYTPVSAGVFFGGIRHSVVISAAILSVDPGTSVKTSFFAVNGSTVPFGGGAFAWVTIRFEELEAIFASDPALPRGCTESARQRTQCDTGKTAL